MMTLPLAIYTADHGLSWTYPKQEIGFAELDACRTALGPLPDFDLGEPGYEGVWVTAERVFVIVCQSAPKWDFRGRDATYLAVTWMSRQEADRVDFEALLATPALRQPTKTPPTFIQVQPCHGTILASVGGLPSTLADGFASVNAIVKGLAPNQTAKLKRALGTQTVTCRYERTTIPKPSPQHNFPLETWANGATNQEAPMMDNVGMSGAVVMENAMATQLPLIVMGVLLALSLGLNVFLGIDYLNRHPEALITVKSVLTQTPVEEPSAASSQEEEADQDAQPHGVDKQPNFDNASENWTEEGTSSRVVDDGEVTITGSNVVERVVQELPHTTTIVQEEVLITNGVTQVEVVNVEVKTSPTLKNEKRDSSQLKKRMNEFRMKHKSL